MFTVAHFLVPCVFSAGLDAPGVYHGVSAGGLDVRQLADAGEEFLLPLVLYLICCDVSLLLNTGVFVFSDLEQLDLLSLCCGVLRFLQDLPGPILPSILQADMIRAVQGEIWSLAAPVLIYLVKPLCPFLLLSQRSETWRTVLRCCDALPARPAAPPSMA